MNRSRLLGAICACFIACFSASTNATEDVVHISKNSNHDIVIQNMAPRDKHFKHSNHAPITSGIENTVFVISTGLIGFLLLHKANKG
jgi:hypothetical protein